MRNVREKAIIRGINENALSASDMRSILSKRGAMPCRWSKAGDTELKYHEIKSSARAETFEPLAFTVSGQSTVTVAVLLIYRPGSQQVSNLFFDELTR